MGQIFQRQQKKCGPKDLLLQLKRVTMKDIFDSLDLIDKFYPRSMKLNNEHFDDVFGGVSESSSQLFQVLEDESFVITFEVLACLAIYSGETYETKCSFIFRLFDFDVSNTLERDEMSKTIQCVCRSLCKVAGLHIPSNKILTKLSEICFQMMDENQSLHVDYNEFYNWTIHNDQLQEFLLQTSGTCCYRYARNCMSRQMILVEQKFVMECMNSQNESLSSSLLLQFLTNCFPNIEAEYVSKLYTIIVNYSRRMKNLGKDKKEIQEQNEVFIKRLDFLDIIKAWISYSIIDIHNTSSVSCSDLKLLLWIYEDEEPDCFRINCVLSEIDPSRNGFIDRMLWLRHLCSPEATEKQEGYNSLIKKLFDRYDEDSDGIVSISSAKILLRDIFKEQIKKLKDMRSVESFYQILDQLVGDIQLQLEEYNLVSFNWKEFHQFLINSTTKYPSLNQLIGIKQK